MLISELDAVNNVLRELGEQPILSLDTPYPTVDLARHALEMARRELLLKGWWFNTLRKFVLQPMNDGSGLFKVPDATLEFIPEDPQYIWSGQYVMKDTGETVMPTVPYIKGVLKTDLVWAALPLIAHDIVTLNAALKVYSADFGIDNKYQEIASRVKDLMNTLTVQHLRATKPSMNNRPAVRRYYNSVTYT